MIGFFDSGLGGLTVLKEIEKAFPQYSYIYLGDNARTPYGSHGPDVIYNYTIEGVEELFRRGAELVILACNTASAVALKKIQKEYLPLRHPDKKVLGIIVPVAEEAKNFQARTIGIFATQATVSSGTFVKEIAKIDPALVAVQQECPLLVPIIESGQWKELDTVVKKYVGEIFEKNQTIEAIILGCTHYAIIEGIFRKHVPGNVRIVSQAAIVRDKLENYLSLHPEMESRLSKEGGRIFLTTEKSSRIQHLAESFYGSNVDFFNVRI